MIRTGELQMRPVLMTCVVACVGLLPAALSTGIGSQVQKPLAVVVVGGMLLAPFLILVTLPVLISCSRAAARACRARMIWATAGRGRRAPLFNLTEDAAVRHPVSGTQSHRSDLREVQLVPGS